MLANQYSFGGIMCIGIKVANIWEQADKHDLPLKRTDREERRCVPWVPDSSS